MLGPDEGDEHGPGTRVSSEDRGRVTRRRCKELREHGVAQELRGAVDEHQVDVLLLRDPHEVLGGRR